MKKKRKHGKSTKSRRAQKRTGAQARSAQGQGRKAKAKRKTQRPSQKALAFKRRSLAAKKGWKRRKTKEKIEQEAKKQPIAKGPLAEWIVVWTYLRTGRSVDFYVIARSKQDAELFVIKAVARGKDSNGADLSWMIRKITWDERESHPIEEEQGPAASAAERERLGEGWVEVR